MTQMPFTASPAPPLSEPPHGLVRSLPQLMQAIESQRSWPIHTRLQSEQESQ